MERKECLVSILQTNLALQDPGTEIRWVPELSLGSVNLDEKNPWESQYKIIDCIS